MLPAMLFGWAAGAATPPTEPMPNPSRGHVTSDQAPHDTLRAHSPTLLVPAHPDTGMESEMVPLTIPGRTSYGDTLAAEPKRRAREQFEFGRQMEIAGDAGGAIVAYRSALRLDPTIRDANYRMALLFMDSGQLKPALECLANEVTRHPDNLEAKRELGMALARAGQADLAIAQLTKLVTADPNDGRSWHALAFAYQSGDRPRDAEKALRRAIALPPPDAEEHRDLGAILAVQHRDAEARKEYHRALAMAPYDPSSWYNLGNLERRAGRIDSALVCFRRAEHADSMFKLAWQMEVQALRERGRTSETGDAYRRWLHAMPYEHGARVEAIQLHRQLGRTDIAIELARDGVRDAGDAAESHQIYGTTLAIEGHTREALTQLREAGNRYGRNQKAIADVELVIARMRQTAPDSLRAMFTADSIAAAR